MSDQRERHDIETELLRNRPDFEEWARLVVNSLDERRSADRYAASRATRTSTSQPRTMTRLFHGLFSH